MRTSLFSLLAVLTPIALHGQRTVPEVRAVEQVATSSATVTDTPATEVGSVHIDADPRIEKLMTSYSEHKHVQRGYRVQIFLGDRKTAEETKRSFLQKNPDIPAYLSWLAPNFRLRVGDLHTRLQAERMLRDMKVDYPGSYIVPDEIEMPVLPDER